MKKTQFMTVLGCSALLFACTNTPNTPKDPLADIEVRAEFEQKPPIARDISIELLEKELETGENLKLSAEFSDEDVKRIEEAFLAIQIGKEKLVLRDDGLGADDKARDGRFSVFIKEDLDQLKERISASQKDIEKNQGRKVFTARSVVHQSLESFQGFSIEDLSIKKRLSIPIGILLGGGSSSASIDQAKSLMITSVDVVEDPTRTFNPCTNTGNPTGPWTFGELMRQMASPNPSTIASDADAINFIMDWLNTWTVDHTVANGNAVNGDEVLSRNINLIINNWQTNSAAAGATGGQLLLESAPFKLTAIVNRLDLRGSSGYGFSDAGEGRFVFCAMNGCSPMEFNVIFEYGINKKTCAQVKAFGQEWADLSAMALGSVAYNDALQDITDQFTLSGKNINKPNQNCINQIRTNEVALAGPWELREFNLNTSGQLEIVDVKMEPATIYNQKNGGPETTLLANFINSNEADILANNYEVPLQLPTGEDFRGGKAHTNFPPTGAPSGINPHHWDGTKLPGANFVNNDDVRHIFSLNTCSGCHGGETQTFFTHIDPAPFGVEAGLSGFLTGVPGRGGAVDADGVANNIMSVLDPAGRPMGGAPVQRGFNDLERREQDLNDLINQNCLSIGVFSIAENLTFQPLIMSH